MPTSDAKPVVSGQLFRPSGEPAPKFEIYALNPYDDRTKYYAKVISHLSKPEILAESTDRPSPFGFGAGKEFSNVGEALNWCYEFVDW